MRRRTRDPSVHASVLGLSLAVAGCSHSPVVTSHEDAAASVPPAADPLPEKRAVVASSAEDRLAAQPVTDTDFARRVFYSWTTRAQIAELVAGAHLLTRAESPIYGASEFDMDLDRVVESGNDAMATHLRGDLRGLIYRRFAWPTAWPTVIPQGPYPYGDQLLRITLKPEAIIARFESRGADRWSFVTASGAEVSWQEVDDHPERLAAVFHVHREGAYRYREYVLCNETMIEEWSTGDEQARAHLEEDANLMRDLAVSPPRDAEYDAAIAFELLTPAITPPRDFEGREAKLRAALANQAATLVKRPSLAFDTTVAFVPPRHVRRGPT